MRGGGGSEGGGTARQGMVSAGVHRRGLPAKETHTLANKHKKKNNLISLNPAVPKHNLSKKFFLNSKYLHLVARSVLRSGLENSVWKNTVIIQSLHLTVEGNHRPEKVTQLVQRHTVGASDSLLSWPRLFFQPGKNFHCMIVAKLLMKMRPKLASENEVSALESF